MITKTRKILFISHDAHRHGAQILLLNLIKALKNADFLKIEVLLKDGGVLEKDFKSVAPATLLKEWLSHKNRNSILFWQKKVRYAKIRKYVLSFDVVVSNTITNGDLDDILNDHPNIITYVHELEQAIRFFTTEKYFSKVLKHTRYFLYPSQDVKDNLVINHNVNPNKFIYLPYYIPDIYENVISERAIIRNELGVNVDDLLILGVGTNDWRKGADLFLTTMQLLFESNPFVKALWVGSNESSIEHSRMLSDIRKMNIGNRFHLLPSTPNPYQYFAAADLFFLSSREDPYPLVVLESAMMNLPCTYFPESGGAKEFLSDGIGFPISYGRVDLAAKSINEVLLNKEVLKTISAASRRQYLSKHVAPIVVSSFIKFLEKVDAN